ncbi:MAG: efflux RND transporter permease subunit, partial [Bacteroidales bacterium]|nr:efflux RND transporter permease subunit [Bacteroidales bacterium]
ALVRVKQMDYQAVPAQVGVRFKGDDREAIVSLSDSLKNYLYGVKGLKWVHSDSDEYDPVVRVIPDADEAARLGVSRALLSLSLAGNFNGLPVATLWEGTKPVPVRIYSDSVNDDMGYDAVSSQLVPTSVPGVSVRLDQVASVEPDWTPHSITRVGGRHTSTVYADLVYGYSQPSIMKKVSKFLDKLDMPEGVEMSVVGLREINSIYLPKIMWSFVCAVAVLFFFLLFHFRKISLAVLTIVLSSICMFGAFFGLWIFNLDFSITAVLGLISIVGIIVRNGIVMFEYAEHLRFDKGLSLRDAAFEAGRRRMRPIFLTSCTTALGVLPMILAADPLWMPLGVVICFGTMLSILLIVLIMPVSYWQVYRIFSRK